MKSAYLLLIIFTLAFAQSESETRSMFEAWKIQYQKSYSDSLEEEYRYSIFVNMYNYITAWNSAGNSAVLGLNAFSDLTSEEFKAFYTGSKFEYKSESNLESCPTPPKTTKTSWNWATNSSIVTPVKNQGQCGSCWAFASVAVTESLYALNGNKLTSFSEQQVVSCDSSNDGCNGGDPNTAIEYIGANGLETEAEYPYTATNGVCRYNKADAIATTVTGYCGTAPQNVEALNNAVAQQPNVVGVEADQAAWQSYSSGVISGACGDSLDHAVTVTGFSSTYFIVKNSWGTSWGENGYVLISNNPNANSGNGVCGILANPGYPAGLKA